MTRAGDNQPETVAVAQLSLTPPRPSLAPAQDPPAKHPRPLGSGNAARGLNTSHSRKAPAQRVGRDAAPPSPAVPTRPGEQRRLPLTPRSPPPESQGIQDHCLREGELHRPPVGDQRRLPLAAGHGLGQQRSGLHEDPVRRVSDGQRATGSRDNPLPSLDHHSGGGAPRNPLTYLLLLFFQLGLLPVSRVPRLPVRPGGRPPRRRLQALERVGFARPDLPDPVHQACPAVAPHFPGQLCKVSKAHRLPLVLILPSRITTPSRTATAYGTTLPNGTNRHKLPINVTERKR